MLQRLRSKLTYPYLVSTIALFVALGGGAYALEGVNRVNSGDVKNNTLTSKDQKDGKGTKGVDVTNNSLKGADVDESSLGQVPSAANANHANSADTATNASNAADADHADQADNATTVNSVGVQGVRYRQDAVTNSPTEVVALGGLTVTANCNGGDLSLVATTSTDNATLSSAAIDTISDVVDTNTVHDDDFDASGPVNLLAADDNDQVLNIQYTRPGGGILNPSAATSAVLIADSNGGVNCLVTGHAFRNGGGFPISIILP